MSLLYYPDKTDPGIQDIIMTDKTCHCCHAEGKNKFIIKKNYAFSSLMSEIEVDEIEVDLHEDKVTLYPVLKENERNYKPLLRISRAAYKELRIKFLRFFDYDTQKFFWKATRLKYAATSLNYDARQLQWGDPVAYSFPTEPFITRELERKPLYCKTIGNLIGNWKNIKDIIEKPIPQSLIRVEVSPSVSGSFTQS